MRCFNHQLVSRSKTDLTILFHLKLYQYRERGKLHRYSIFSENLRLEADFPVYQGEQVGIKPRKYDALNWTVREVHSLENALSTYYAWLRPLGRRSIKTGDRLVRLFRGKSFHFTRKVP